MTIPKEIIEKAIEGGWNILGLTGQMTYFWTWRPHPFKSGQEIMVVQDDLGAPHDLDYYATALDPTFWQAMGKALGWKSLETNSAEWFEWNENAHRFYDLILTSGDLDAFWADLLTPTNKQS